MKHTRIELPDHIHLAAKTAAEKTGVQMRQWLADAVEAACVFTAHSDPVIRAILDEGRKKEADEAKDWVAFGSVTRTTVDKEKK